MSDLKELLELVENATGPDREIDADLFVALINPEWVTSKKDPGFAAADKRSFWPEGKARYITRDCKPAPQYTASIDAAVALVERMLPGWSIEMVRTRYCTVEMWKADEQGFFNSGRDPIVRRTEGYTLPLAILAALLKALIAQEGGA